LKEKTFNAGLERGGNGSAGKQSAKSRIHYMGYAQVRKIRVEKPRKIPLDSGETVM
jgi:hypothetical protein